MIITIYDKSGIARAEISAGESSTQQKGVQSDNVLSLSFTHYEYIALDVNDYVDFDGERYWLTERYVPAQKSEGEWVYDVKFYGIESMIKRFLVLETTDNKAEPVFTLTATAREHVAMVVKCINNGMGHTTDWKVGRVDGSELIVIDYEGKYCDEALKEIAEKVGGGAEWWVEGQTVNICRCEYGEEIELGYGKGLTSLDRDTGNTNKFYTRLFPIGSSRNIDAEKYGHSRLMLPGGRQYVEVHTDEYGVYDHYEKDAFSGIYPRRTGEVSSVRKETKKSDDGKPFDIYYFTDGGMSFDPNEYELAGEKKRVSFEDGELAGLGESDDHYFEVNFDSKTREFELITIWPYDDDTQVPGGKLVPKIGDHYILWNVSMPNEYYRKAEEEFLAAVEKYNDEHWQDVSVYKAPTDHVWVEENKAMLYVGRRVRLLSGKYFPENGYRQSRITKITRKVNLPSQMDLEISDALQTGALEKVNDNIGELKNYTKSRIDGVELPDIIRSWEKTPPTDNNLFSARRSQQEFLSRKTDDNAKGVLTFEKGLLVGAYERTKSGAAIDERGSAEVAGLLVRDGAKIGGDTYLGSACIRENGDATLGDVQLESVKSKGYTESDRTLIGGNGFELYKDGSGKSHLYVDNAVIRGKLMAAETEVRKISYSGGTMVLSNAGSTLVRIVGLDGEGHEVTADASAQSFKCWAAADDGTTQTMNCWKVGDMAMCKTFNISGSSGGNRYYWRMVIGCGQEMLEDGKLYDYVVLSNIDTFVGADAVSPVNGGVASFASVIEEQDGKTTDDAGVDIATRTYYGFDPMGTDVPMVGDVIVQVGSETHFIQRGNVIKLATSADDGDARTAPSLTMYHQIGNTWSTEDGGVDVWQWKTVTAFISPTGVRFNADYFKWFSGSEDNVVDPIVVSYVLTPSSTFIVRQVSTGKVEPTDIMLSLTKHTGNKEEAWNDKGVTLKARYTQRDGLAGEKVIKSVKDIGDLFYLATLRVTAIDAKGQELCYTDIAIISDGEDFDVQVLAEGGNSIFNGEGSKKLTAYVYRNGQDITATIAPTAFSWKRQSGDVGDDKIWNSLHDGLGNVCTVNADDIDRSAMFMCEVAIG